MKSDEFDLQLMDEMSQLPPPAPEVHDYTPWQASIRKILWGMVLITFRFEFFYLQYLLPLLGATLLYLGYRSLRKSDPWFTLCWGLSAFLLVFHMAADILAATPLLAALEENVWTNGFLLALTAAANVVLLFALRAGIRRRFVSITGEQPRDWLGRGLIAYLLALAVTLWATLEPATEPSLLGVSITNPWLHYGRLLAVIALQIYLLVCILRQSEALAGRGYDLVPAPVRVPGRRFVLGVFLLVLLAILPTLWLSCRLPTGEAQELTAPLAGTQSSVRDHLVKLGLPQELADTLDEAELARCAGATAVRTVEWTDDNLTDDQVPQVENGWLTVEVGKEQAELSTWLVFLPDDQVRYYHWFRYDQVPVLPLQEQFSVDPSGYYPTDDYSAQLVWETGGGTFRATPEVHLAGGETMDELEGNLWAQMFPESARIEIDRLGHLHYSPYFSFSIPRGAEKLLGYLSYTVDAREMPDPADIHFADPENWPYTDSGFLFLRHQVNWLHYPFRSIDDLGGSRSSGAYGPIRSAYGRFSYSALFSP